MKIKVIVTDEDGFVLSNGEIEVPDPGVYNFSGRLCLPGVEDPLSDIDLALGVLK